MEELKNLEQNLDKSNEKLHISDVMNSILVDLIKEVYQRGYDDAYAEIYNAEYVGVDKSKIIEIEGLDNILNDVVRKYCS
jgi:hypothetical protein